MLSWGRERACGLPCELQAGSGLVMAPLTFPRCRLWLAWFPVGSVCFLGFSSGDLLHIHPTLCLPALNPCECKFPCKDSAANPRPWADFFCFSLCLLEDSLFDFYKPVIVLCAFLCGAGSWRQGRDQEAMFHF